MNPLKLKLSRLRENLIFETAFMVLAVLSVLMLVYEVRYDLDTEMVALLARLDISIALLFLTDYLLGQYLAENNRRYFRENWYILLASIPVNEHFFRSLRILRALRLIRVLRTVRITSALSRSTSIPRWYRRTKAKKNKR